MLIKSDTDVVADLPALHCPGTTRLQICYPFTICQVLKFEGLGLALECKHFCGFRNWFSQLLTQVQGRDENAGMQCANSAQAVMLSLSTLEMFQHFSCQGLPLQSRT